MKHREPIHLDVADIVGVSQCVAVAVRSGLLELVASQQVWKLADLANTLGYREDSLRRLLGVLRSVSLCSFDGEGVSLSEEMRQVHSLSPSGLGGICRFWSELETKLAEPKNRNEIAAAETRGADYSEVAGRMGDLFTSAAESLASYIQRVPRSVLDIGCGSGVWGLAVASRFLECKVFAVDLPAVLPAVRCRAERLGMSDRLQCVPGDMFEVELAGLHDIVIMANILHLEADVKARTLFMRGLQATESTGTTIVVEAMDDTTAAAEVALNLYHLNLGLRGPGGVKRGSLLEQWAQQEGLSCRFVPLGVRRPMLSAAILQR